jgi:hypothetical protein
MHYHSSAKHGHLKEGKNKNNVIFITKYVSALPDFEDSH